MGTFYPSVCHVFHLTSPWHITGNMNYLCSECPFEFMSHPLGDVNDDYYVMETMIISSYYG